MSMSGKERVNAFFKKEPIDVMPAFSGMGMVTIQAIDELGYKFAKVHTNGEMMANSSIKTAEIFDFDAVIAPYDMCAVAEALGRGVSLYEDAEGILYPTVPTKWATMDDVELPDEFSGIWSQGRLPVIDDAIKRCVADGRFAVGGWVLGPFTMAGQVIELDVLLKGLAKDRKRVMAFLDRMTDLTIEVAKHYQDLGVDYMTVREMGSGTDLLSPRMWKSLIKPNMERVFEVLTIPSINHICGGTDLIVAMMNECGADAISVDQKNTLTESREKIGDDVILLGNFDPYSTLVQIEAEDVAPVIKACVENGVDAVWPGCDLWPDVKKENVEAFVKAVREYGAGPTAAVGRL